MIQPRFHPGTRYARSVFLQGLLASNSALRPQAPASVVEFHRAYHQMLKDREVDPIGFALSSVLNASSVDFMLIGVDSRAQLMELMKRSIMTIEQLDAVPLGNMNIDLVALDPRNW